MILPEPYTLFWIDDKDQSRDWKETPIFVSISSRTLQYFHFKPEVYTYKPTCSCVKVTEMYVLREFSICMIRLIYIIYIYNIYVYKHTYVSTRYITVNCLTYMVSPGLVSL